MDAHKKEKLLERNNKIIECLLELINRKCPNSVDLIGIAGSFCNEDIHENSDLDLVIIANDDKAKILNMCFIMEDIGFDIYTSNWDRLTEMSTYKNPYVTKLFDLDINYIRNEQIKNKYAFLQQTVKENMQNISLIHKTVAYYFSWILGKLEKIDGLENDDDFYLSFANILNKIEFIIYMLNQTYIKKGVKRIPEELLSMSLLPKNFQELYMNITNFQSRDEASHKISLLTQSLKNYLKELGINYKTEIKEENQIPYKKSLQEEDLTGTYEEIVSNWYNKMLLSCKIKSQYLSFVTMASCQAFYDEMFEVYDIPKISLISKYNSQNLEQNVKSFEESLAKWKELYDSFGKKILIFKSIKDFENYCQQK